VQISWLDGHILGVGVEERLEAVVHRLGDLLLFDASIPGERVSGNYHGRPKVEQRARLLVSDPVGREPETFRVARFFLVHNTPKLEKYTK
jgi:hypothetical protein